MHNVLRQSIGVEVSPLLESEITLEVLAKSTFVNSNNVTSVPDSNLFGAKDMASRISFNRHLRTRLSGCINTLCLTQTWSVLRTS